MFLSSRHPVSAGSSGWLPYSPWLYALRCLATGIVTLFSVRGLSACPSRTAGPRGSSVLRPSGSSRWGHLSHVRGCFLLQSAIVTKTIPPSGGIGSGPSRWGPLSWVRAVFFSLRPYRRLSLLLVVLVLGLRVGSPFSGTSVRGGFPHLLGT